LKNLKLMGRRNMVYGPSKIEDKKDVCRACALGKIHRESFSKEKT
jgi:hypothetical protein